MPFRMTFLVLLGLIFTGPASAQFAPTGGTPNPINNVILQTTMVKYYESPKGVNVVAILKIYEESTKDRDSMPPIIGFMAGLFTKYPTKIDSFLPEKPTAFEKSVISSALRLTGQSARLSRLQEAWGGPARDILVQSVPQKIGQIRPVNGDGLDVLWGAFFATGELRYVQPIIDTYVKFANASEQKAEDALTVGRFINTRGDPTAMRAVVARYPQAERMPMIIASTALWGLKANGSTHKPVSRFLSQYEAKNAGTPAGKALKTYREN
jgi:hypothetical protein